MKSNIAAQARRGKDVRHGAKASSRRCLEPPLVLEEAVIMDKIADFLAALCAKAKQRACETMQGVWLADS